MSSRSDSLIELLRRQNPALDIRRVTDPAFAPFGRVLEVEGIPELVEYLCDNTPIKEGTTYVASDVPAEKLPIYETVRREIFGCQDIQIGWCNGTNDRLNALEYHASVEVNVAESDAVLLLAKMADSAEGQIDTCAVRGFYLEKGQAVLLESSTLHFAPCAAGDGGFRVAIILPRGTNTPLAERKVSGAQLWMQNKWLLAHREASHLVEAGAHIGLSGPLIVVRRED